MSMTHEYWGLTAHCTGLRTLVFNLAAAVSLLHFTSLQDKTQKRNGENSFGCHRQNPNTEMPCVCVPSEWIIINIMLLSGSKQFSTCRQEMGITWIPLASKYSSQMNAHLKSPSQDRVALSCHSTISITPSSYNCKFSSCKRRDFFSLLDSKPKKSIGKLWKLRACAIYQRELGVVDIHNSYKQLLPRWNALLQQFFLSMNLSQNLSILLFSKFTQE